MNLLYINFGEGKGGGGCTTDVSVMEHIVSLLQNRLMDTY